MSISELRQMIDNDLLRKSSTEVKVKKFDKCEEIEAFYRSQGFDTRIGKDLQGAFVLTISFKTKKR